MPRRGRPRPEGRPPGKRKRRVPKIRIDTGPPPLPDTDQARLEEETRKEVAAIVAARRADRGLDEKERMLARILDQHPELAGELDQAASYHPTGELGSAFMHVALHHVVERRVVTREGSTMTKLAADKPWHEAVHEAIAQVVTELFGADSISAADR